MRLPRFLRPPLARLLRGLPVRGRWRIAPLLNRLFPVEPIEGRLPDLGRIRLDLGDEDQLQVYWTGLHPEDRRIVRFVQAELPSDGVFLDVGANIGIHTLAAARHLGPGGGAVVSFEPHPANFAALTRNLSTNGHRHVTAENLGLAECPAVLTCRGEAHGGNWSLASRGETTFDVRLVRLDDYLAEHPLPRLDVMKIDVEGAEVRVLLGATGTLELYRPVVLFEVAPAWLARLRTSSAELFALLARHGYSIHALTKAGRPAPRQLAPPDVAHLGSQDWTNLVALPFPATSTTRQRAEDAVVDTNLVRT